MKVVAVTAGLAPRSPAVRRSTSPKVPDAISKSPRALTTKPAPFAFWTMPDMGSVRSASLPTTLGTAFRGSMRNTLPVSRSDVYSRPFASAVMLSIVTLVPVLFGSRSTRIDGAPLISALVVCEESSSPLQAGASAAHESKPKK